MVVATKIILAIVAIGLIAVVLLQSSKGPGLSGAVGGGAEHLVGKAKARGIDALLSRLTTVFAILFMIMALVVGFFMNK